MSDIETLQMALIGYEAERQKIEATMAGIRSQLGLHSKGASAPAKTTSEAKPKHRMSAAGRARIAEAQRKRWAATKKATEPAPATSKPKRRLSAAGKAAIVAALKKRWAAKRAAAKTAAKAKQAPAAKKTIAKKAPVKASRRAAKKGAAKRAKNAAATVMQPGVATATE
jgi:hypothetical protein